MYIQIPYAEAVQQYPDEVNQIVRKIRGGKGKRKDEAPDNWKWQLCIGEEIETENIFDLLSTNYISKPKKPLEERLFVDLRAEIGKSWARVGFDKIPDKVIAIYTMRELTTK